MSNIVTLRPKTIVHHTLEQMIETFERVTAREQAACHQGEEAWLEADGDRLMFLHMDPRGPYRCPDPEVYKAFKTWESGYRKSKRLARLAQTEERQTYSA